MKKTIFKYFSSLIFLVLLNLFICKPAFAIRIGLVEGVREHYVAASVQGYLINGHNNRNIMQIEPMKKYPIKINGSSIAIKINGQYYDLGTNYLIVQGNKNGFVSAKNRWYRGNLVVLNRGSSLTVINDVPLESYLLGVVPAEMPSSWNIEAQKAQAIAARSYAIANLGKRASRGYDLKDTPEDQAYGGASVETPKTNAAVMNTAGQVLTYNSKIIPAYYHASSGGHTVTADQVWSSNLPFLRAVPAYDNNKPKNGHGVGMSQHGANNLANYGYNAYQILGYFYKNVSLGIINAQL